MVTSLASMQVPLVEPCVVILGVLDHELRLALLNSELPPTLRELSLRHIIEDGRFPSVGNQPDGDIGEGVGDVTGHHCTTAPRHRHWAIGAYRVVPACVERQGRAAGQLPAALADRGQRGHVRTSKRQNEIFHTDWVKK